MIGVLLVAVAGMARDVPLERDADTIASVAACSAVVTVFALALVANLRGMADAMAAWTEDRAERHAARPWILRPIAFGGRSVRTLFGGLLLVVALWLTFLTIEALAGWQE